jgi:hypothetical protein
MKISVVTWDADFRESLHTIKAFASQRFPLEYLELIWVDFYGSNDRVIERIRSFPRARLLTLNHSPDTKWHLGRCINEGVRASSGEVLVLCDGDIFVDPHFCSYVAGEHAGNPELALYFRRYDEPAAAGAGVEPAFPSLHARCTRTNPTNYAACLTIRRENFDRIKGYETHHAFNGPGMSGKEIYVRIRNAGMCVKWAPTIKVYHPWHRGSGPRDRDRLDALRVARMFHQWIVPYSGIGQSWIVRCRELNEDVESDESRCNDYLSLIPVVDLAHCEKLASLIRSTSKSGTASSP